MLIALPASKLTPEDLLPNNFNKLTVHGIITRIYEKYSSYDSDSFQLLANNLFLSIVFYESFSMKI